MEAIQNQITYHPEAAGLAIGFSLIIIIAAFLAGIQKIKEWRNGDEN